MAGALRIGRVSSCNYEAGKIRVVYTDHDANTTVEVPLLSFEYFMPQAEDLVAVFHSDSSCMAIVLGGYWNSNNMPPESGANIYRKDLSHTAGECYVKYDEDTDTLTIHCNGDVNITADGNVRVTASNIYLNE